MRIDAKLFGYAAGLVAALAYFICGFFAAVGSGATQGFFSYVLHLDLLALARPISVVSFAVGLVLFSGIFAGFAWVTARVYNALAARTTSVATSRSAAAAR